jgi:hypothetical protein
MFTIRNLGGVALFLFGTADGLAFCFDPDGTPHHGGSQLSAGSSPSADFLMSRDMLRGLKERAESLASASTPVS